STPSTTTKMPPVMASTRMNRLRIAWPGGVTGSKIDRFCGSALAASKKGMSILDPESVPCFSRCNGPGLLYEAGPGRQQNGKIHHVFTAGPELSLWPVGGRRRRTTSEDWLGSLPSPLVGEGLGVRGVVCSSGFSRSSSLHRLKAELRTKALNPHPSPTRG